MARIIIVNIRFYRYNTLFKMINKLAFIGVAIFIAIVIALLFTPIERKIIVKTPEPVVLMYTWDDGSGDICLPN